MRKVFVTYNVLSILEFVGACILFAMGARCDAVAFLVRWRLAEASTNEHHSLESKFPVCHAKPRYRLF